VATALGALRKRLKVELVYGEVAELLEQLAHGRFDRSISSTIDSAEDFPAAYDQIHLSNIP